MSNVNRSLVNDVAIVGVGGAGTNIAFRFEKLGYPTSPYEQRIKELKQLKTKFE